MDEEENENIVEKVERNLQDLGHHIFNLQNRSNDQSDQLLIQSDFDLEIK